MKRNGVSRAVSAITLLGGAWVLTGSPVGLGAQAREAARTPSAAMPADDRAVQLAKAFQQGVDVLADDAMEGRGIGTAGLGKAADWIEARLRALGLDPAFGTSYRQLFKVKIGVKKLPGNRLQGVVDGDWTPLGFSSAGEFSGEIAFVGYGIDAAALGYREYEGVDLRGKVALMLRYEPQERDEGSPFDGRQPSRWSALRYRVLQARERGAVAVVFATGPAQDEGEDKIPALKNDGPESPAGLPVFQVKTSVAKRWLSRAGIDLGKFQTDVDRDLVPRSMSATGVRLSGKVALEQVYSDADNVAGILPGRGALAGEVVVVGAHYDHLGMGGEKSMRPNVTAIHNGADDNASGVVSALLIAQELLRASGAEANRRTIVFALFAAEELGLGGSSEFVAKPPRPLDRIVAMMNLDMVGQLRDDLLIVYGTDTAKEWSSEVAKAAAGVVGGLSLTTKGDGYGPSDQTSFYAAGIPVLFLFTGQHERYHTPDDDPATVNAAGAAKVIAFATTVLRDTAMASERPTYQKASGGPSMGGDSRGYGAYLGTVPDYRAMEGSEGGVLLADVRTDGPADRAGIKGGDTIVEMAGTRIENLHDMTYALQDHKPGDTIVVVVLRKGDRLSLKATLGDRQAMGNAKPAGGPPPPAPGSESAQPAAQTGKAAEKPGPHVTDAPPPTAPSGREGPPAAHSGQAAVQPGSPSHPSSPAVTLGSSSEPAGSSAHPSTSSSGQPGSASSAPHDTPETSPGAQAHQAPVPATAGGAVASNPDTSRGVDPFYEDRPGRAFLVGAGRPYPKTFDGESHLEDIRQLTFGGENAEAYFSPDGTQIIFQATPRGAGCDQQFVMDLGTGDVKRVSSGKGRTTCGYFRWPQGNRIIFASTEAGGEACPPSPDRSKGYVWALYDTYDIWEANSDGSNARRITTAPGYDAEATWCHRGGKFVFTSLRDGDLDLYTMDEAGDVRRLTSDVGYDGGAFFSPDCAEIVWRASRPQGKDLDEYRALLGEGLIRPKNTEIFIAKADGTHPKQLTSNGAANFCPDFTADGKRIIFTSNVRGGRQEFELYLIPKEGGEPEQLTFSPGFDGFPVFSPDGRWLVWASNRADPETHETNLFIARWSD